LPGNLHRSRDSQTKLPRSPWLANRGTIRYHLAAPGGNRSLLVRKLLGPRSDLRPALALRATMKTKLHLGCGHIIKEGWVNHDLAHLPGVDVVHDLRTFPW